ncbi:MAG: sensor histidine kinase [Rickettsiales bacterium]|jgi:two-component system sensor histidine kinase ChiS|nr:sensor histidine kinase [Rickettsiales bacterium]
MIRPKAFSLSRDFFRFAVVIVVVVLAVSGGLTWSMYRSLINERIFRYENESIRVVEGVEEAFSYVESFFSYIGEKVEREGTGRPSAVAEILQETVKVSKINQPIFTWTFFDFVNPKGRVVASSTQGVLDQEVFVDPKKRAWMIDAPQNPRKMYLSWPDIGVISGEMIIPAGYGVINAKGEYLGAISMGFNINKLRRKLGSIIAPTTSFAVFDKNFQPVMQSLDMQATNITPLGKIAKAALGTVQEKTGKIEKPIIYKGFVFGGYGVVGRYGYTILVGENEMVLQADFEQRIYPLLMVIASLAIFFIVLLYFFQRIVVAPVVKLSDTADQIAAKEQNIIFPRGNSYEVNNLVRALMNVRRSFNREEQLKRRLEVASVRANEANQAKSRFLANMSHELRTPLGAIMGFSELMQLERHGELNKDQRSFVDTIHHSAKHLLELINTILNLSKVEAGKEELIESDFDLGRVLLSCKQFVAEAASRRGIALSLELEPCMCLYADKIKIKQIIINLLSNSVKFTDEGGMVTVTAHILDGKIVIQVQDTGIGIRQEDIGRIMDEFGQAGDAYTRKPQQGTGLGLSIVKKYSELHDAVFTLHSQLGRGTTTKIVFPKTRTRTIKGMKHTDGTCIEEHESY